MLAQFRNAKIVPVLVIEDITQANQIGACLVEGGLPIAEVTMRTEAALASMATLRERGDVLVGAGSVHNARQAKDALAAGAQFIVTPGLARDVIDVCHEAQVFVLPGVLTPSEVIEANNLRLSTLKFFPANALPISTLRALAGPFGATSFVPTGGISADNCLDYLRLPNVIAVGGTWLVTMDALREQRFDDITETIRQAVELGATL